MTDTELLIPLIAEFVKASPARNFPPEIVAASLISVAASIGPAATRTLRDALDKALKRPDRKRPLPKGRKNPRAKPKRQIA
jgi:acyl carrier protein phosphodiesterase